MTTYGFALGISDSLVHGNDQTRSLHCATNRVDLDQTGLPDKCFQIVTDAIGSININTDPFLAARVSHTKLVQDVGRVKAGIIADLPGYNLECLCERDLDELKLSRDRKRMLSHISRKVHLNRGH